MSDPIESPTPLDIYRDETVRLSIEGHDRDCALAMLSQARHSRPFGLPLTDVQVTHLLAIGYRAGAARARDGIARELYGRAVKVLDEVRGDPGLRRAQADTFEVAGLIAAGVREDDLAEVRAAAQRPGEAGTRNASKEDGIDV